MDEVAAERSTHWKAKTGGMVGDRWPIRCGQRLAPGDLVLLREGLWPHDMDDRWIVWLDGSTLRCWRSWTRTCIYEAQVTVADDGHGIISVVDVLDRPDTYRRAHSDEAELQRFEGVLGLVNHSRHSASPYEVYVARIDPPSDADGAQPSA